MIFIKNIIKKNNISNRKSLNNDLSLVFTQNKKNKRDRRVKSRKQTIAERINRIPDNRFQLCGGVKNNDKTLNSPLPKNSRLLNDNDDIKVVESKNTNIPQVNKGYKYIFQNNLSTKKFTNKSTDKSKFRTHWAYPKKPKARQGKVMKQFNTVGVNEIIIDIDANKDKNPDNINLPGALKVAIEIVNILLEFDINVTVYYSGLKGFHIAISLPHHYEFNTLDIDKTDNIVVFYHNLIDYLNDNINDIPDNVDLDYGLEEVSRLIQLRNKKKDNDNGRGYKICIGSNKDICRDIKRIKEASRDNKDLGNALRNNKNNLTTFINFLNELQDKGYDKPITINKTKTQPNTNNTNNTTIGSIQEGLNPILNELNKKHKQDGHRNIRTPLPYTVKAYLPDLEDALPFIKFLMEDERHGDKGNTVEGLINAFNEGKSK